MENMFKRSKEKLRNRSLSLVSYNSQQIVMEIIRTGKYPGNVHGDDKSIDDSVGHATSIILAGRVDHSVPDAIDLAREFQLHPTVIEFFNLYKSSSPLMGLPPPANWGILGIFRK